mgnify:CR=1 FL=1|jgi:ribosomal protein S18 acetylase RimI-like enzyme
MQIRKATKKDIPIILEFMMDLRKLEKSMSKRNEASEKTRTFLEKTFIGKRIDNTDYVFLIGFEDEKPIGIAVGWKEFISPVYKNEYVGHVCDIIVGKEYRGKGYGKELTSALEHEFKKMGLKEMMLEVLIANKKSTEFWKSNGFEELYAQMRKDI